MPVRWSMIGHLQTNKVKDVLRFASEVQSLDRLSLAQALEQRLQVLWRRIDVLVQVTTSGEASKYGISTESAMPVPKELAGLDWLRIRGLIPFARFTPG